MTAVARTVRLIAYLPLRLALPLGGEATERDVRRQLQPRLDLPLPASYTSAELVRVLAHRPFRSILYYRLRTIGIPGRVLAKALSVLYRGEPALFISSAEIGPGLMMMHGFATIIAARRIGTDCQISQQVTIGYDDRGDAPVLGDRVRIGLTRSSSARSRWGKTPWSAPVPLWSATCHVALSWAAFRRRCSKALPTVTAR